MVMRSLRIQTASPHGLLKMRRVAAQHGSDTRTLRVVIGSYSIASWSIDLPGSLQYVDYQPIDWDALLVLLPGVRRLDLTETPLTSPHVVKIVLAASTHCMELEALVLPTKVTKRGVRGDLEPLLIAMAEAAKKWGAREEQPGLSELTVPCYAKSSRTFSSAELLRLVFAECPRLMTLVVALCHSDGIHDGERSHDTVGNAFCEMLAMTCPQLALFSLRDVSQGRPVTTTTRTLTDEALVALGGLAFLTDLRLRRANMSGFCLFDFLSGFPTHPRNHSRLFQITIGAPNATERLLDVFLALLQRLEATRASNLRLATGNFLLRVDNGNPTYLDDAQSRQYLRIAESLVHRVKAKHPSLRVRLTLTGLLEGHFDQARHFWLYTSHSTRKPPRDDAWGYEWDPLLSFANLSGSSMHAWDHEGIGGGCG